MKKFKQFITEVQRYEYGEDDINWWDVILSMPFYGWLTPTSLGSNDIINYTIYPWGDQPPDRLPPGWRPKDSAYTDPKPPGDIESNPSDWYHWYARNYEYIDPPPGYHTHPGLYRWDEDRGWYIPKPPVDPTRWYREQPSTPPSGEEVVPTPPNVPNIRPGVGSQHYEI